MRFFDQTSSRQACSKQGQLRAARASGLVGAAAVLAIATFGVGTAQAAPTTRKPGGSKVNASDKAPVGGKAPVGDASGTSDKSGADEQSAAGDRIAVMPLELGATIPAGRPAIEEAVRRGLAVVTNVPVLVGPEVAASLGAAGVRVACVEAACFQAVGRTLTARHLVTGNVDRKGADFVVEFKIFTATDGRMLDRRTSRCEAAECSVAELCRMTVLEMARSALGSNVKVGGAEAAGAVAASSGTAASNGLSSSNAGSLSGAGFAPAGPGVVADATGMPASVSESADVRSSWLASWRSWYPPVAIAAGAVAGAVGGYLISTEGKGVDDCGSRASTPKVPDCNRERTIWPGVSVAGAGAALLASGIVVMLMDSDESGSAAVQRSVAVVRLGVSPAGLLVAGRF